MKIHNTTCEQPNQLDCSKTCDWERLWKEGRMGSWDFGMCTKVSVWHFKYYSKAITMARHFIVYLLETFGYTILWKQEVKLLPDLCSKASVSTAMWCCHENTSHEYFLYPCRTNSYLAMFNVRWADGHHMLTFDIFTAWKHLLQPLWGTHWKPSTAWLFAHLFFHIVCSFLK